MPKTKSEPKKLKQANKSPKQTQQQPILSAAQRRAKAKRTLTIFGVSVAVIFGLVIYFGFGLNTLQERGDMKNYLEERYGEEFIVGKPERKASGLAVEGYLEAEAYPKDDDSLIFLVRSSSADTWDGYLAAVWEPQEESDINKKLEGMIGGVPSIEVDIGEYEIRDRINGTVPSFNAAADKYGSKIGYELTVKVGDLEKKSRVLVLRKIIDTIAARPTYNTLILYFGSDRIILDDQTIDKIHRGEENIEFYVTLDNQDNLLERSS